MANEFQERHPHFIKVDDLDESGIRGLYSKDLSQYLKITKLTLQKFLEACISENGQYREFFKKFATFTADFQVNEVLDPDPNKRHLQIARYFSGMREYPPQIFIQDRGYPYRPASLGSLTEGWNTRDKNGKQVVRVMDVVSIPIDFVCAAVDQQQAEDLAAFLSLAFGQAGQRFTCNYILAPNPERNSGAYWEVRIPLPHDVGAKSHTALHGDPRNQLWQVTISMTVVFENSSYIMYNAAPAIVPVAGDTNMIADLPSTLPVGKNFIFRIMRMPHPIRVYSSDSRIAIIQRMSTHFVIQPKRLGSFKVVIVKGEAPSDGRDESPAILEEKEITITVR